MATIATGTQGARGREAALASAMGAPRVPVVLATIGGAWLVAVLAQLTGNAGALHHHALIEGGSPLWVAVPLFLVAWQVMIGAMMLPASLPTIRAFAAATPARSRPGLALAAFVGVYALVWTLFGLTSFLGDVVLHHLVDATPWLAARPWLIEASVLALAGGYQFVPLKRDALAACRHPNGLLTGTATLERGAVRLGSRHALECLASSWALMLVMFAAGFADLWWMVALSAAMAYETMGRHGQRAASAVGLLLLGSAALVVMTGWLLGFGPA